MPGIKTVKRFLGDEYLKMDVFVCGKKAATQTPLVRVVVGLKFLYNSLKRKTACRVALRGSRIVLRPVA